jgi:precorrin-8X/cobalt-precorrin-8 methylmutase
MTQAAHFTIKELSIAVGDVTPRMVRHYHQLGLLPQPDRSPSNYRLYTDRDVQRLKRIVALKQQGFQLSHIRKLLETDPETEATETLTTQLQRQYQSVIQQIAQLRQTASALEGLLGRDRQCQQIQADAIAQLRLLEVETQVGLNGLEKLWNGLDAAVHAHPETFEESLQRLLPDLSDRSEIEVDLLTQLVLACGDVSLVQFVRLSRGAIAAARHALKSHCTIIGDILAITSAFDQTRLCHLGCPTETLINNSHITNAVEAEQAFWQQQDWQTRLLERSHNNILVIGYAPSVLLAVCDAIQQGKIRPALVIGMPIGFSHAPAAKRQLMRLDIPFITIEGTVGGGVLASTALNALAESLIEKPNCHCYLEQ